MSDETTVSATVPQGSSATVVTGPASAPVTTKTVEHAEASDLPEVNWFFRRIYIFALTIALAWMVWHLSLRVTEPKILRDIIRVDQWLIALLAFLYIAGASAEGVVKLVAALKTTRKETVKTEPAVAPLGDPSNSEITQ